jgi:lysine 2,3-aminomutase
MAWRRRVLPGGIEALHRIYPYYDPIDSVPASGQARWRENATVPVAQDVSVGYESFTPASDGGTVPDQYGAAAGADGGEDPVSIPGRPSVTLP